MKSCSFLSDLHFSSFISFASEISRFHLLVSEFSVAIVSLDSSTCKVCQCHLSKLLQFFFRVGNMERFKPSFMVGWFVCKRAHRS